MIGMNLSRLRGMNAVIDLWGQIKTYYAKVKELGNRNYVQGRNFEYRAMAFLRKNGWHCMRRFGSFDEHIKDIGNVPIDITAFKNGTYLIVSCKYSGFHATTYLNDEKRENLVKYAERFGATCIPVFCGVNDKRQLYFIDLRVYKELKDLCYRYKNPSKEPEKKDIQKLVDEAWGVIEFCNSILENKDLDLKIKVRFANTKASMISALTRLLYVAGATQTSDDLTKIIEDADKALKEKGRENVK
jgi:Holliday junction resolvase